MRCKISPEERVSRKHERIYSIPLGETKINYMSSATVFLGYLKCILKVFFNLSY
jgi:hypothetical protein